MSYRTKPRKSSAGKWQRQAAASSGPLRIASGAHAFSNTDAIRAAWPHPPCAVHVVTAENRKLYEGALEASFRLRHQVYVTERHWDHFRSPDQRELDQYDNANAIYLLAIEDGTERLVGGARLLPTMDAPLLGEFRNLVGPFSLPRSPFVFHLSRSIVAADRRGSSSLNPVAATILSGIQEYCLAEEIEQLTLLVRMSLLPTFMELGWNPQPLSIPEMMWGFSCIAATLDVSEHALRRTKEARGITGSVLVRRGITLPAVSQTPGTERLC